MNERQRERERERVRVNVNTNVALGFRNIVSKPTPPSCNVLA